MAAKKSETRPEELKARAPASKPVTESFVDRDFCQPDVAEAYERFLQMIVCAGSRDRFKAMDIRKAHGIEAALEFIKECTLESPVPRAESLTGAPPQTRNRTATQMRRYSTCAFASWSGSRRP